MIEIESVSKQFEEHLAYEENTKILFSGRFGIGKTYFLNTFFEQRKSTFNKILISPVNYVISSNEDVFELIKADIIQELFLTGKVKLEKLPEDNKLQTISSFVENNPLYLLRFMNKLLAKINPVAEIADKVIEELKELHKKYQDYNSSRLKSARTVSENAFEYVEEFEEKIGNVYENNYITKVINIFLKEIKQEEKKNVLIIDDLDRIDPEHIFRILNILSAHNSHTGKTNKFLFDYVIIVCDIENIRRIYYHKYGPLIDFDGYIDKFYSRDIFQFTNNDAIQFYVESIYQDKDKALSKLSILMIQLLIKYDQLNLRKLLKIHLHIPKEVKKIYVEKDIFNLSKVKYRHNTPQFMSNLNDEVFFDSNDLFILDFFKMFAVIFGHFKNFLMVLSELTNIELNERIKLDFGSDLAFQKHLLQADRKSIFIVPILDEKYNEFKGYQYPNVELFGFEYRIIHSWATYEKYTAGKFFLNVKIHNLNDSNDNNEQNMSVTTTVIDFFKLIQNLANLCIRKGYLNKVGIVF